MKIEKTPKPIKTKFKLKITALLLILFTKQLKNKPEFVLVSKETEEK